jgi:hypothetical protein
MEGNDTRCGKTAHIHFLLINDNAYLGCYSMSLQCFFLGKYPLRSRL